MHVNVTSIMPKLDQLKTIARYTKAAIIGITESQIDNSRSVSEVEIPYYCIFDDIGTEIGGSCMLC